MTLRILGAGFGRTGTLSLKFALDALGFGPCHHMYEVRKRPKQVAWWSEACRGEKLDWNRVFAGFGSQVDWPGSVFWRDLVVHYPDAKVILTDRDPDAWYESISRTILPASEIGRFSDPDPVNRQGSEMIYQLVLQGLFEGRMSDREYAIAKLVEHRDEVIRAVPPERLLVFRPGDGWGPLCDFLNVPKPDGPFPRGNSVAEFRALKPYLDDNAGAAARACLRRGG